MELLLWRHAEAMDGSPDHARELTPRGKEQAWRIAAWLKKHAPGGIRLLVSPAVRARQTAAFFREEMEIREALASDAAPDEILALLDWPNAAPCVIVGHQPMLGEILARLLKDARYLHSVRKGALWWLSGMAGEEKAKLRCRKDPGDKPFPRADHLETAGK
ncbi:MAG: histidine phosphatase family protein [Zoogloeaceae bacterium]|jgi:phosphohistidine phosphatase|nr:histidine phosphatase family protein [Zoogloeaceae bacterium]